MPETSGLLRHTIDHVIAQQHDGENDPANLALACATCNRHKGPNLSGWDAVEGAVIPLFHPRQQGWAEHFRSTGAEVEGLTPAGRATVKTLAMNLPDQVHWRRLLLRLAAATAADATGTQP